MKSMSRSLWRSQKDYREPFSSQPCGESQSPESLYPERSGLKRELLGIVSRSFPLIQEACKELTIPGTAIKIPGLKPERVSRMIEHWILKTSDEQIYRILTGARDVFETMLQFICQLEERHNLKREAGPPLLNGSVLQSEEMTEPF